MVSILVIELDASQPLGRTKASEVRNYTDSSVIFKLLQFPHNWSLETSVIRQGKDKEAL